MSRRACLCRWRRGYAYMKWFHKPSGRLMVATPTMRDELSGHGFRNISAWSRGVDTEAFRPRQEGDPDVFEGLPRPIFLYVGRVAVEKNIDAFVALDLPGTKVVVGPGPQKDELAAAHPEVRFTGAKSGAELAAYFAGADVFVFPSLTDTFGLVILEAMASGTPVAAYPAPGPIDIIPNSGAGVLAASATEGPAGGLPGRVEAGPPAGARFCREILLAGLRRGFREEPAAPTPNRRRPASGAACAGWPGSAANGPKPPDFPSLFGKRRRAKPAGWGSVGRRPTRR